MDAEAWNRRYAERELVWGAGPNRFLAAEATGLPPGRALDLACGEGRNAIWLAEQGWTVTAVDFSATAIEKGQRLAAERGVAVDWFVADVLAWEPPEGSFDLVAVFYLQVPEADRSVVWPRAVAAVAPGGTFLLVAHDSRNLTDGSGGPQDPSVLYTPDDVVPALAGFEIERAEAVRRPVEQADGSTVDAIDCLVRARRPPS